METLLLAVVAWRLAASVALLGEGWRGWWRKSFSGFTLVHRYLLHSSQVVELGVADLLLQHELLEVLSGVGLPLQRLQSLETITHVGPGCGCGCGDLMSLISL